MKKFFYSLLAIVLIIEEWLWELLTAIGQIFVRWLHLEKVERWLSQTSPNMALVAFSVPLLIVTPINLAAFWLLAHGLIVQGLLLEVAAKLLGTLLVARVFALTKTQLLTFRFFNSLYTTITGWLRWAHQKIIDTAVYRFAKRLKQDVKQRFAAWFH